MDIQHLIEMNRLTRLVHKAQFLTRQRLALAFSHNYIISERDVTRLDTREPGARKKVAPSLSSVENTDRSIDEVLAGFEPDSNEIDRRIFYEVTGRELVEGEYEIDDTSDDEWHRLGQPDPWARILAMNLGGGD